MAKERTSKEGRKEAVYRFLPWLVLVLGGIAAGGALYFNDPAQTRLFPPCLFHSITGLHCPGCGSTRAVHALVHGRLSEALAWNPLAVALLPFLAAGFLVEARRSLAPGAKPARPLPAWIPWTLLILVVLFWILRNIPVHPLTLLAPGGALS